MIDPQTATEVPKTLIDLGLGGIFIASGVFVANQVIGMVIKLETRKKARTNGHGAGCALGGLDPKTFQEHVVDIRAILESDKRRETEHKEQAVAINALIQLQTRSVAIQETQTRILERIDGRR